MCVFFFQAEDGIRDYKVTGVQTCALPICALTGDELNAATDRETDRIARLQRVLYADGRYALLIVLQGRDASGKDGTIRHVRSEERRVGKECRSRWSRYH